MLVIVFAHLVADFSRRAPAYVGGVVALNDPSLNVRVWVAVLLKWLPESLYFNQCVSSA